MLIDTHELSLHLNDPQWVIFDCRHDLMDAGKGERLYREGHIPGAHFASIDTDLSGEKTGTNGRHPLPSPAAFATFLARHGVAQTAAIVAYDDVGGQFASRLWWMARWIGLANVYLLDGGIGQWIAEGRAISTDVPVPQDLPDLEQQDLVHFFFFPLSAKVTPDTSTNAVANRNTFFIC